MMQVLSNEQAFSLMERKFAALGTHDVIELCYKDRRFPAIVISVNKASRTFEVIPLHRNDIGGLLHGLVPSSMTVRLSSRPEDQRPMWNTVGGQ